jgi:tetratricopeptide (TPR) repeat protein
MSSEAAFSTLRRHSWAVLLCAGAASAGLAPALDGDLWWHLAAGREILQQGELLRSDPFSVSAAGKPWIDVHWLFQLSVLALHRAFGLVGVVGAKCVVIGTGAVLLLAALGRKRATLWAAPALATLLVGALLAARQLLLPRPVIVTLLMLAAFFYVLERFGREGRSALLLWLLPLQIVWANCQGLAALGPALVSAYAVGAGLSASVRWLPFAPETASRLSARRHFRSLVLACVVCGLGMALTPYGLSAVELPTTLLTRLLPGEESLFARAVAENVPPFVLEQTTNGEFWHLKWFLGVLALAMLAGGRRVRLSHALLLIGLGGLALMSNRNVLLFYWLASPIAALQLGPFVRRLAHAGRGLGGKRLAIGLNVAALTSVLGVAGVAAGREPSLAEPSPFRMPTESARLLRDLPAAGDVFSADHQGGYLIWQLYPRLRPYIDTRLVLRSSAQYAEYLGLSERPERFDAFQARHHFGYVVLPTAYPDRYLGLIRHLYASASWKLLYSDGAEVLFARSDIPTPAPWRLGDDATTARIVAHLQHRFGEEPELLAAARLQLATLHAAVGELGQVELALGDSHTPEADALRARAWLATGDLDGAERLTRRLLERDRDDVRSLNLMALVAMQRGQPQKVTGFLRRALSVDPFDAESNLLLSNLEETDR